MISFHNKEPNEDGVHNGEHDDRRRKLVFTDESQQVHTSTLFLHCRAIKVFCRWPRALYWRRLRRRTQGSFPQRGSIESGKPRVNASPESDTSSANFCQKKQPKPTSRKSCETSPSPGWSCGTRCANDEHLVRALPWRLRARHCAPLIGPARCLSPLA